MGIILEISHVLVHFGEVSYAPYLVDQFCTTLGISRVVLDIIHTLEYFGAFHTPYGSLSSIVSSVYTLHMTWDAITTSTSPLIDMLPIIIDIDITMTPFRMLTMLHQLSCSIMMALFPLY